MDRLHRTRLMFGDRGLERLHNATVMVVGCGAVGSFAIEALARSGIGTIVIVDFDNVDTTNINRQLFALDSTVGRPKVDVATSRIHDINPTTTVRAYNLFWDRDTDLDERPDFVLDAIDSVESKIALARWASDRKIPIISSMGAALKSDITQIQVASLFHTRVCPLASRVRRLARSAQLPDWPVVYSTQPPLPTSGHAKNMGSLITVTGTFGLMLAGYVIEELVK